MRIKIDGGKFTVDDYSFNGKDSDIPLKEYAGGSNWRDSNNGFAITSIKKYMKWMFLKMFKQLVRLPPEVVVMLIPVIIRVCPKRDVPKKLTEYDAMYIQTLKVKFMDRIDHSEKSINQYHKALVDSGVWKSYKPLDMSNFKEGVGNLFDIITVIVESDSYYRQRWLEFILLIWADGHSMAKSYGDNFFNDIAIERSDITCGTVHQWANKKADGKNRVTDVKFEEAGGEYAWIIETSDKDEPIISPVFEGKDIMEEAVTG